MSGEKSVADLLRRAVIPEHSVLFMEAMSGCTAFVREGFLFLAGGDRLIGIGYPLADEKAPPDTGFWTGETVARLPEAFFRDALPEALEHALRGGLLQTDGPLNVSAIAPEFPAAWRDRVTERDSYHLLPVAGGVPAGLRRFVRQAGRVLRVEEGVEFTPEHRRLWSEQLARPGMSAAARGLYARTEAMLRRKPPGVALLDARDADNRLAASLLLDFGPEAFCSYIIGAHSRQAYSPHATDLLFSAMLERAAARGKRYIHLGLGVNEGIRRFKQKWGGRAVLPFQMAAWSEEPAGASRNSGALLLGMLGMTAARTEQLPDFPDFPDRVAEQKPFAMLWELEKNGRKSWIGGTAHFFQCSFRRSFARLFSQVDQVLFEGHLDQESLDYFEQSGRARQQGDPCLHDLLAPEERQKLTRMVRGPEGSLWRALNHEHRNKADVRDYLLNTRPWFAFFSLWTAFLERHGWRQSVDLEAWHQAHGLGKSVLAMESREEQLATLEAVPIERIVNFLRNCHEWPSRMRRNRKSYLLGDLGGMAGSSTEFPTLVHKVIGLRDQRFCERMLPFIEKGRCAVFVGSAHMLGLRVLLAEHGFKVIKLSPGPLHRVKTSLHAALNPGCDLR